MLPLSRPSVLYLSISCFPFPIPLFLPSFFPLTHHLLHPISRSSDYFPFLILLLPPRPSYISTPLPLFPFSVHLSHFPSLLSSLQQPSLPWPNLRFPDRSLSVSHFCLFSGSPCPFPPVTPHSISRILNPFHNPLAACPPLPASPPPRPLPLRASRSGSRIINYFLRLTPIWPGVGQAKLRRVSLLSPSKTQLHFIFRTFTFCLSIYLFCNIPVFFLFFPLFVFFLFSFFLFTCFVCYVFPLQEPFRC